MDSSPSSGLIAWVVLGVSLVAAGWLYLAPPIIHLEFRGGDIACSALGPEQINSGTMLLDTDADKAVYHLMESRGYSGYTGVEQKIIFTELKLEAVAACRDARLNRQTAMALALAVGLAAFGVGYSLRRSRVQNISTAETHMEGEGE